MVFAVGKKGCVKRVESFVPRRIIFDEKIRLYIPIYMYCADERDFEHRYRCVRFRLMMNRFS